MTFPREGGQRAENLRKKNRHVHPLGGRSVRASHILLLTSDPQTRSDLTGEQKRSKRKLIDDILKRAKAGEDFNKLMKEYSEDPGPGTYTFPRGQMVAEFESAAFSLGTNEISRVVTSTFGFHIVKLLEKIPAKTVPYAEAAPKIREYLKQGAPREIKPRKASEFDVTDSTPSATGTGFFITDDGYFISNYHVVKGATKIQVVASAGTISAKVVKVDSANDLALLKADGKFSSLPIAASRGLRLGATVATVGFPNLGLQGFAPKLAKGEIAALSGAADDARYFQISVPVQPGNSGLRRAVVVSQRNSSQREHTRLTTPE